MILSLLKRIVKRVLHEAAEEWLVEVGVSSAAIEELRQRRRTMVAAAEAKIDAEAAAALAVADDDALAALPGPASAPAADACPAPGDETALRQWVGRRREEGLTWPTITKSLADAGHDLTEAALRRRCRRSPHP